MKRLWKQGVLLWVLVGGAWADEPARHNVTGFDDTEVEIRVGEDYRFVPVAEIGTPPLPILEDDGSGFVKVRGKGGRIFWVGRSWLRTDEPMDVPTCGGQTVASKADHTMASVRGMGERCQ